jgi:hypothetical protein
MTLSASWLPKWLRDIFVGQKIEKQLLEVQQMASLIRNNKHLREILLKTKPELRKAVYEQWKPMLTFKPKPYNLLFK